MCSHTDRVKAAYQSIVNVIRRLDRGLSSSNGSTDQSILIATGQITRMDLVTLVVNTGWATKFYTN